MELIAQPWAAGELRGPSSLPVLLEDNVSVAEAIVCVQFKKSIAIMKRKCVLWSHSSGRVLSYTFRLYTLNSKVYSDCKCHLRPIPIS